MNYKVGDRVYGMRKEYDPSTENHPEENNDEYLGIVIHDFEDGSYIIKGKDREYLIETYYDETIVKITQDLGNENK